MWFPLSPDVIPAIDVLGEEAVRLHRGDYNSVIARGEQPVELAAKWIEAGARRLHLVDLDGARAGGVRPELVSSIVARCGAIPVQASGGIRGLDDARALLDAGADRVIVGTAAWPDPTQWLALGDSVVLALDVQAGHVRSAGWTAATGVSFPDALERAQGARVLVTAIDRDGTLAGPDLQIVGTAVAAGLRVLAAGGVRSPADVAALRDVGAEAIVVGRALLTGSRS